MDHIDESKQTKAKFAILSDIDGVLTYFGKKIGSNTDRILDDLHSKYREEAPMYFVSNNGGLTEQEYADGLNRKMGKDIGVKGDQMLLCHTPLRDKKMRDSFKNKTILVTSRDEKKACELLQTYGYTREHGIELITMMEYACLYSDPQITWLIDMPDLEEYFQDETTGESYGPAFPKDLTKVKPIVK